MTAGLAAIDRLIIFLLGLLLIAGGLIPVGMYWEIPYLSPFVREINRSMLTDIPSMNWYTAALITALVISLVLALALILPNIRSRAFNNRTLTPAQPELGKTRINVARLAQAACTHAETTDLVTKATHTVTYVNKRPTVTFTINANPNVELDTLIAYVEQMDTDFCDAVDTMDIDTVFKLHLDKVKAL